MVRLLIIPRSSGKQGCLSDVGDGSRCVGVSHENPVELLPDKAKEPLLAAFDDCPGGVVGVDHRVVVLVYPEEAHVALAVLSRAHVLANGATRAVGVGVWLALGVANFY